MHRLLKRGFVLMETIVVIAVLSVILIMLYAGYSNILTLTKTDSNYDNIEYLYKTSLVRKELKNYNINPNCYDTTFSTTICSSTKGNYYCNNFKQGCYNPGGVSVDNSVFKHLKVKEIYITRWDIDVSEASNLPATTQLYIKNLNSKPNGTANRIIVMFENEDTVNFEDDLYQYASLEW